MAKKNRGLTELFQSVDAFGQVIQFQAKNKDQYRTTTGSIISLLIYSLVAWFGYNKYAKLMERSDTSYQTSTELSAIEETEPFNLADLGFNLAFGLVNNDFEF